MEDEQEFPQDDAILPEHHGLGHFLSQNPNDPHISLKNMEDCLKTKFFFTEQEIQQFMNSPECAMYVKLTNFTHSPYSTLRSFMAKTYKPFVKSVVRTLYSFPIHNIHYIHYDGQMLDEFFANENIIRIIERIKNVKIRNALVYYLYASHGIILETNATHYKSEMRDSIHNKEIAHAYFCTHSVYFKFCKNHELQRRAIISTIHENANQTSTTCNAIRMFADEYIVSKILDFF
jgi:hypothetical protein